MIKNLGRDLALKTSESDDPQYIQHSKILIRLHQTFCTADKLFKSQEGITAGDPTAMAISGVAILLYNEVVEDQNWTRKRYAEDGDVTKNFETLQNVLYQPKEYCATFGDKVTKFYF